jgi:hypothetical protein
VPPILRSRPVATAAPLHRPHLRTPTNCNNTELQALHLPPSPSAKPSPTSITASPAAAGPRAPSQRYSKSYLFSLYVSLFHTIHIISNLLGHNPYEFSVPITPLPVTCTHRSGVQQVVFVFCICLSFLYYAQYCEPTVPQFLRVFSTSQTAATSRQLRDVRHSGVW